MFVDHKLSSKEFDNSRRGRARSLSILSSVVTVGERSAFRLYQQVSNKEFVDFPSTGASKEFVPISTSAEQRDNLSTLAFDSPHWLVPNKEFVD